MVLKKQTAWLLTMLSLIIVLSVYYIFSSGESPANVAYMDDDEEEVAQSADDADEAETAEDRAEEIDEQEDVESTATSSDETFAALRIKINEARDKQLQQYQEVVASGEISAEMKSEAYAKMERLNDQSKQISVLESLLSNQFGFEDVIVNPIDERNFNVIVKAESLSNKEANEIMRKTVEHLGEGVITVEYTN